MASGITGPLMQQFEAVKNIPMRVLANWPAYFGFFGVNYIAGIVLSAVPQLGGTVGVVEQAAVQGFVNVLNHVTWEAVKVA